jgi:hypothetical protein
VGIQMLKNLIGRMMSREIWHLSNVAARERQRKKALNKYFEEKQQNEEKEMHENRARFASHIEKADRFLQDVVMLEDVIENKLDAMEEFFENNGNTKHYHGFFLTTPQKQELKKLLGLRPVDYIKKDLRITKTEENTIEFILEQTSTYRTAEQKISSTGHRMLVDAQLATIYFSVIYK